MDKDIDGRRSNTNRRQFSYSVCLPERRSGKGLRSDGDRRAKNYWRLSTQNQHLVADAEKNFPIIQL